MKLFDVYKEIYTSSQDAEMLANAQADYYRSLHTRTLTIHECVNHILNGEEYDTDLASKSCLFLQNVTYYTEDPQINAEALPSVGRIIAGVAPNVSNWFNKLNDEDTISDPLIPGDDVSLKILTTDGSIVYIDIDDFTRTLGFNADIADMTAMSFEALRDSAASIIYSKFNYMFQTADDEATAVSTQLADIVSSNEMDLSSKLLALGDILGTNRFKDVTDDALSPQQLLDGDYDSLLGEVTGASPCTALFAGINVDWSNAWNAVEGVTKTVAIAATKAVVSVAKAVWNIGKSIFGWISNKIKTTFVDPVDYEVTSGKTIEYPEQGCTYGLSFNNLVNPPPILFPIDSQSIRTYGTKNARSLIQKLDDTNCVVQEYFKPIDPKGFAKIVSTHFTSTAPGDITYQQVRDFFNELAMTDLTMDSKSNEVDVYNGMLLSHSMYDAFGYTLNGINNAIRNLIDYPDRPDLHAGALGLRTDIDLSTKVLASSGTKGFVDPGFGPIYSYTEGLSRFLLICLYTANIVGDASYDLSAYSNMSNLYLKSTRKLKYMVSSVNNLQMLMAFTVTPYGTIANKRVNDAGTALEAATLPVTIGSNGIPIYTSTVVNGHSTEITYMSNASGYLVRSDELIGTVNEDFSVPMFGYFNHAPSPASFTRNVKVKADSDLDDGIIKCIVGIMVAVAAVVILKKIPKWKKDYRAFRETTQSDANKAKRVWKSMIRKARNGQNIDQSKADEWYKKMIKAERKLKISAALFGTAGVGGVSKVVNTVNKKKDDSDQVGFNSIMSLIKA